MSVNTVNFEIPDLTNPATFASGVPHDVFDRVRAEPDLVWQQLATGTKNGGVWLTTRYDDVAEVLQNPELYSSTPGPTYPLGNMTGDSPIAKQILFMDPPEHSRVRRAAVKSFGPRVVANFDRWIQQVVEQTLDEALPQRDFDWIDEVARTIPGRVIARVMGVSPKDHGYIVSMANDIFDAALLPDGGVKHSNLFFEVGGFLTELAKEKLVSPGDDMVTVLAQSLDSGEIDLPEYQLYSAALLIAGFETTHTMIGQIGHSLATDDRIRGQVSQALTEGRTLDVVEEFIRVVTPAMAFTRTATKDHSFRGQEIRQDDTFMVFLVAANRDPAAFANPHEFNAFREGAKPVVGTGGAGLAFSAGPHRCVGHHLAKLELRLFLEELHRRNVSIRLDGQPERTPSALVNQYLKMPVTTSSD